MNIFQANTAGQEVNVMYKTLVVQYTPKVREMATKIEEAANQMEQKGFELISCSVMPSSKGILVFKQKEVSAVGK